MGDLHAKEAVTKTEANPPIPPTNGASPIFQYLPPIYILSVLPPQLTAMPRKMKMMIVATFKILIQYSSCSRLGFAFLGMGKNSYLAIQPHSNDIGTNQENPDNQSQTPARNLSLPIIQ